MSEEIKMVTRFIRPLLWRLETRFSYRSKAHSAAFSLANKLPRWLREAVIINATVRATTPPAIGPDDYAGPDGVDFARIYDHA